MMYCPECGGEYRDGFVECADCGVALVTTPPPPAPEVPDLELVTVLETGDPAEIAFVESLLLEEGIPYSKQGDGLQDLFGAGRVGAGFNVLTGPARLLVPRDYVEAATALLRDMPDAQSLGPDTPPEAE